MEVTTGVLQGETLSPILFILFISDIVSYFRDKGLSGLQLNNFREFLMLLYADDLVILVRRQIDVSKALSALEEYCSRNGLEVNTGKTKVVPFCKSRFRKKFPKTFHYKDSPVEVVDSYVYLGIIFTTMSGRRAALEAAKKASAASSASLGILSRLHADSWAGKLKIFGAIVRSTLLYLAGIWGLDHLEIIEKAQVGFFKRLLQLPFCTLGYAVRLETGVPPLAIQIFDTALRWATKILKMDNDRLLKICFLRLLELSKLEARHGVAKNTSQNWVSQLGRVLSILEHENLLNNLVPETWEAKRNDLITRYTRLLHEADLTRYNNSSSCQLVISRANQFFSS